MNEKQRQKLANVIEKRLHKMESVNYFVQYFEDFAYNVLKRVVLDINGKLETVTAENLKVFYDNPYENKRTRYFVMVQLYSNSHRRDIFLLDNTKAFPSLIFEGDEFTGSVKTLTRFEDKVNRSTDHNIADLRNEDFVSDILIEFLDKIYSL